VGCPVILPVAKVYVADPAVATVGADVVVDL